MKNFIKKNIVLNINEFFKARVTNNIPLDIHMRKYFKKHKSINS